MKIFMLVVSQEEVVRKRCEEQEIRELFTLKKRKGNRKKVRSENRTVCGRKYLALEL